LVYDWHRLTASFQSGLYGAEGEEPSLPVDPALVNGHARDFGIGERDGRDYHAWPNEGDGGIGRGGIGSGACARERTTEFHHHLDRRRPAKDYLGAVSGGCWLALGIHNISIVANLLVGGGGDRLRDPLKASRRRERAGCKRSSLASCHR
jgi:hypothetical protein